MKIHGEYELEAAIEEVWRALFDPVVLAAAIPGCKKLELAEETHAGELEVAVSSKGTLRGTIALTDVVEHESLTLEIDARGAPGFVKATVSIALAPLERRTKLTYEADASAGGELASAGEESVERCATAIAKRSLDALQGAIQARVDETFLETSRVDGEAYDELPVISRLPPPPRVPRSLAPREPAATEVERSLVPRIAMWGVAAIAIAGLVWLLVANLD